MEAVGLTQTAGLREAVILAAGLSPVLLFVTALNLPRDPLAALQVQVVVALLGLTQKTSFLLSLLHCWSSFETGASLRGNPEERADRRWHPAGCTEEVDKTGRN
jgi:hypothetical protein